MKKPLVKNNVNTCKVVFIGESAVGKTNIISKFRYNTYEESYLTTIGLDFHIKTLNIRGKHIKLQIWDTAGHPKFREILDQYYKIANVICFCYDITNKDSISNMERWLSAAKELANENVLYYAIGNKSDKGYYREIDKAEFKNYCDMNNIINIEVSALESTNISNLFYDIAFKYSQQIPPIQMEIDSTFDKARYKCIDCCTIC